MAVKSKKIFIVDNLSPQVEQLIRSLKDDGFRVDQFETAEAAWQHMEKDLPHIILLDWSLSQSDGKKLYSDLKANVATRHIPLIVMTKEIELEDRLQSLSLDIADYVSKPFYYEEVVARIDSLFQEMELLIESRESLKSGFMGHLSEMNLVDLIQTLELGRKSGIIHMSRGNKEGQIFFKNGKVVDAIFEGFDSSHALTHMLTWLNGTFYVNLQPVERRETISEENRDILKKGSELIHHIRQLSSQLPPLDSYVSAYKKNGHKELSAADASVLSLFSEPRPIIDGIEHSDMGDIKILERVKKLIDGGYLVTLQSEPTAKLLSRSEVQPIPKKHEGNGYAKIVSFFRRKGNASLQKSTEKNRTQQKQGTLQGEVEKIPYNLTLTKAELMLLREQLLTD